MVVNHASLNRNFNPLPPCGGRLSASVSYLHQSVFQSTPSVWRETEIFICMRNGFNYFNPLPPCGGRLSGDELRDTVGNFNPLPPCGGRRTGCPTMPHIHHISIHSLRVEGDAADLAPNPPFGISIHSLRVEGDQRPAPPAEQGAHFNPLPPCGGRQVTAV